MTHHLLHLSEPIAGLMLMMRRSLVARVRGDELQMTFYLPNQASQSV